MLWTHTHASLLREGRHYFENTWVIRSWLWTVLTWHYIYTSCVPYILMVYVYVRISYIHGCAISRFAPAFRMSPLPGTLRGRLQGWSFWTNDWSDQYGMLRSRYDHTYYHTYQGHKTFSFFLDWIWSVESICVPKKRKQWVQTVRSFPKRLRIITNTYWVSN